VKAARLRHEQQLANLWKRNEHLAARFDRLEASPRCAAAMRMLDYNATRVRLEGVGDVFLTDRVVMGALAARQERGAYTEEEQAIRDAFDAFFANWIDWGPWSSPG
jgi:hypothetical protein